MVCFYLGTGIMFFLFFIVFFCIFPEFFAVSLYFYNQESNPNKRYLKKKKKDKQTLCFLD